MQAQTILKKTREVGTSAGVLLPRSWLNKQVVVTLYEPSKEKILLDVLACLLERNLNGEIKGIYLYGSYARKDHDINSDIDILVLTQNTNKLINQDNYEILLVSESSFSKNLPKSLNYQAILKESKAILNSELINKYKNKKYRPTLKESLKEIKKILKIDKEAVETCHNSNTNVPDGIVYSLILRLRELYLIKCILSGKTYYKKDFLKLVRERPYSSYLRVKKNSKELNNISPDELKSLFELSKKWLKELKG